MCAGRSNAASRRSSSPVCGSSLHWLKSVQKQNQEIKKRKPRGVPFCKGPTARYCRVRAEFPPLFQFGLERRPPPTVLATSGTLEVRFAGTVTLFKNSILSERQPEASVIQ